MDADELPIHKRFREAGFGALLAFTTEGPPPDRIVWVAPQLVAAAAIELKKLILSGDSLGKDAAAAYDERGRGLVQDLDDDVSS